jgi:hypothetical protein
MIHQKNLHHPYQDRQNAVIRVVVRIMVVVMIAMVVVVRMERSDTINLVMKSSMMIMVPPINDHSLPTASVLTLHPLLVPLLIVDLLSLFIVCTSFVCPIDHDSYNLCWM